MKIRTLGWLVGFSAIASSFISCTQAKVTCLVGHAGAGPYTAQFLTATDTPAGCAAKTGRPITSQAWNTLSALAGAGIMGVTAPDTEMTSTVFGDQIGVESYHPPNADGTAPDFTKGSIALQSEAIGETLLGYEDTLGKSLEDPTNKPYALGTLTSEEPDGSDFCSVPTLAPAVQKFPQIPSSGMDDPGTGELDMTYEWKNVQFYVTAAAQGTQFSGDLTYTQVNNPAPTSTSGGATTCTVQYHVRALWPSIPCTVGITDKDYGIADQLKALADKTDDASKKQVKKLKALIGQPDIDASNPMDLKLKVDETACCPNADPANGRATGSGINPDFPVKCDAHLGLCVLDAPDDAKLPILGAKPNPICGTSTTTTAQ